MNEIYWAGENDPLNRSRIIGWLAEQLREEADLASIPDATMCMAVFRESRLIGAVAYHHYHDRKGIIETTAAATDARWLQDGVALSIYVWPFIDLGCHMVVARTSEHNKRLYRQFRAAGMIPHRIEGLRDPENGVAEIFWTYAREDFLRSKFMKRYGGGYGRKRT